MEQAKPSGPIPNVLALVVPPYSLTKDLMERIKDSYQVVEAVTLDVAELQSTVLKSRLSKPVLVVLSSLDNITE